MRLALGLLSLLLLSCVTTSAPAGSKIGEFYDHAKNRKVTPGASSSAPIDYLSVRLGLVEGCKRMPAGDESAIIVSDPDAPGDPVVQVFVNPRVSYLDPREPSEECLKQLQQDTRAALQEARYTDVILFPAQAATEPN